MRVLRSLSELGKTERGVEALFVRLRYKVDDALLDRFPDLRVVATPATGLVHLDLDALRRRGLRLVSLKGETAFLRTLTATAELAWGHVLSYHRSLPAATRSVVEGEWDRDLFVGEELRGKTLGVIGMGRLGVMVARYGVAFGMRVIYADPRRARIAGASRISFARLLAESDVISVHVHATPENDGMFGAREFARMKRRPLFVNTSRGELIDETALLRALKSGWIRGAGLDVLRGEHWNTAAEKRAWHRANPLIAYARSNRNLLITPHIGGLVQDGARRAELFTVARLLRPRRA